jgi:DNA repair exonuclease SbcCD ATPase subunit
MKRTTVRVTAMLLLCMTTALLTACGDENKPATSKPAVSSEDVKKEVRDASETTMAYFEARKKAYQEQVAARLEDYDKKLDELKAMAMTMGDEARTRINQKMEALQKKVASAYQKLDELKMAADNAWEGSKPRMDSALAELENAYQETNKEVKDASEGSLAYLRRQRDEYQKQIEAQLKEYDQKLDELQVKVGAVKQEAKALLNQQIQALREKQHAAHDKLDKLSTATGKAWEDLKSGMDTAMENLAKAYHDAVSHFE